MNTKTNSPAPEVGSSALVLPFFRVILTRLKDQKELAIVSNPRWDCFSRAESSVQDNSANDYVEHANCGCVYRMIRYKDRRQYGIRKLRPEWTLDPRQNERGLATAPQWPDLG